MQDLVLVLHGQHLVPPLLPHCLGVVLSFVGGVGHVGEVGLALDEGRFEEGRLPVLGLVVVLALHLVLVAFRLVLLHGVGRNIVCLLRADAYRRLLVQLYSLPIQWFHIHGQLHVYLVCQWFEELF